MGVYQWIMVVIAFGGIIIQQIRSELNLARWRGTMEERVRNLQDGVQEQKKNQGDIFAELKGIRGEVHELANSLASIGAVSKKS